jgi:hypothetical protein
MGAAACDAAVEELTRLLDQGAPPPPPGFAVPSFFRKKGKLELVDFSYAFRWW